MILLITKRFRRLLGLKLFWENDVEEPLIFIMILFFLDIYSWQHYIKLSELEKNRKLNDLLDALDFNQVVIFVKSVSRAAELNKLLVECNFPSICIHSGMSQEERFVLAYICECLYVTFWMNKFTSAVATYCWVDKV